MHASAQQIVDRHPSRLTSRYRPESRTGTCVCHRKSTRHCHHNDAVAYFLWLIAAVLSLLAMSTHANIHESRTNGNITGIADGIGAPSRSRTMDYDGVDRLITANAPGMWGNGTYTYDALDNIRVSTLGSNTITRSYDAITNRLTEIDSLTPRFITYDTQGHGNVATRAGFQFTFDQANRLRTTKDPSNNITTQSYDGLGRRLWVRPDTGTTRVHAYSQAGQLLFGKAIDTSGITTTSRYVYLGTRLIAEVKDVNNGALTPEYVHTDGLGSPVAHTTAGASVTLPANYEPYGYSDSSHTVGNNVGFTGHWNDAGSGLVYMQQRYYDPVAGRFLSMDPKLTDTASGGNFNRYMYGNNNPYRHIDPDGRNIVDLAFLAHDLYQFGVAVAAGEGVAVAAVDVGISMLGVASPVPFVGQALKGMRTAEHAIEGYRVAGKAREAVTETKLIVEHGKSAVQREQYLRDAAGNIMKGPDGTARRIDHVVIENGMAVKSVETTSMTASKTAQQAKEQGIRDAGGTFVRDRTTGKLVDFKDVPTKIERVQ